MKKVHKAIIPAAGLGTRFLPATKAIAKEMLPNEESLERFLVSQFNQYNQKFLGRIHKGFKEIQDTLESMI